MSPLSHPKRIFIITAVTIAAVVGISFVSPISQDSSYYDFADQRVFLGVPNFLNVSSNIVFIVVGGLGLWLVRTRLRLRASTTEGGLYWPYTGFFLGAFLTGFGSAYFHLAPGGATLLWDRLPMTIAFMSFTAAMIAERVGMRAGLFSFVSLLVFGAGSVIYWHLGEQRGIGDLRPYVLVQFYPLLLIPMVIALFPSKYSKSGDIFGALIIYLLAKLGEALDQQIFSQGQLVSGHTLKHVLAAAAVYWILRMFHRRLYIE